ncbi:hypothetical protein [Methylobacterium frigidaeris]|uniref:Uncharacterized protein n=1 Tax=Methylobacterium frigidaeris TaxID=2038277 RepID=A0AA37HIK9_9HYPH|nr:hypothetical protein [Methylobacterium frigidaeris]PIK73558.1 hypothetical protein CS379_07755 [Methylobacterium frigidaeris]GJD66543.1 hypothetical protein MPEAHAMD_6741 [Methylobacterium frigidaeris]
MTKVFIVAVEDHEGCGTIRTSVHATLEGATAVLREIVAEEFDGYEDFEDVDVSDMSAVEIAEAIDEVFGKSAFVEEHEVRA